MAWMEATWWLNEQLEAWLGEKNAADALTLSAPGNVTSEMGLALLDVADVIRPHPHVVVFLQHVEDEGREGEAFLDELAKLAGGRKRRQRSGPTSRSTACAASARSTSPGHDGPSARPRWAADPRQRQELHAQRANRRLEQGRQAARSKEQELLERLRASPGGVSKAEEAKLMIDRVRTFSGYREYPKYGIVARYLVYKQALLDEAERLVQADVLRDKEDIFYLTFHSSTTS